MSLDYQYPLFQQNGNNSKKGLKDFIAVPRQLRQDCINGKLTKKELDVLIWIFLNNNPYNGSCKISYKGLVEDFKGEIKEDNARKIISSLLKKNYIYYQKHRGRGGPFLVYPLNFLLTNGRVQTLEYIKNKLGNKDDDNDNSNLDKPESQGPDNSAPTNHNYEDMRNTLVDKFSMDKSLQ